LALGKTVAELRATMTVREFVDWQRFAGEHPFPADLIDWHAAMAFALLGNINLAQGAVPLDPLDYVLVRRPMPAGSVEAPPPVADDDGPTIADRMMSIFH
jgi:hypothetical protein